MQGLSELIHAHDLAHSLQWSYKANIIMPIFIVDETDEVKHPPQGHKASNWRGQDPNQIVIFMYYSCSKRVEVIWIRNVPEHMLPTAGLHCRMICFPPMEP